MSNCTLCLTYLENSALERIISVGIENEEENLFSQLPVRLSCPKEMSMRDSGISKYNMASL